MQKVKIKKQWTAANLVRRLLVAWLFGVTVAYLCLPGELRSLTELTALREVSPMLLILACSAGFGVLSLLAALGTTVRLERWCLAAIFAVLATVSLTASFLWAFLAGCLVVLGILLCYTIFGWNENTVKHPPEKPDHKAYPIGVAVLAIVVFLLISAWTVGRFFCFYTPSYDFGIFSQMFYNMKATGLPITTLEREITLSHFRVHVSPVYYLLLPLYYLFPTPAALQVFQAAVMVSAVIPLWKLGKQHGLTDLQRLLLCACLLLFPAFSGGAGYDIHENCFLTALILWLFLGIDRKNALLTICSSLLILGVKEDAAVYTAVIGLWLLGKTVLRQRRNCRWNLIMGGGLLVVSVIWFFAVCAFLEGSGDGVMTYRYRNFMYGETDSLIGVVFAVLRNPLKLLYECCDPEKLPYIGITLLPILGLPLVTRRYERYILLIPYLLMNLMSDYPYQHNIFYQYGFGSTAFLMYLMVVNLGDFSLYWQRTTALLAAAVVCAGCFGAVIVPEAVRYPAQCVQYSEHYQQQRELLDSIPQDAPVSAGTFYTSYLSQRSVLYDIRYATKKQILLTEYVVVDVGSGGDFIGYGTEDTGRTAFLEFLKENGYRLIRELDGTLYIYYRQLQ